MSNEAQNISNDVEGKKVESGFDKSLKGEQSFPPRLFRVNVMFNTTVEDKKEEFIEAKE